MSITSLEEHNIFMFYDEFSVSTCSKATRFILERNLIQGEGRPKLITFMINSNGGDLRACFGLIDVMKGSAIPIKTVAMGLAASCGCLLLMSGTKGHRFATPNSSIMSHQYSWGSYGKHHSLLASQKEMSNIDKRMIEHYKKCTGMTEKIVREKLLPADDVWLTANEATNLGIIDKIISTY